MTDQEYEAFCELVWKKFDDPGRELLVVGLGVAGEAGAAAPVDGLRVIFDRLRVGGSLGGGSRR